MKVYNEQQNVGRAKYVVNFHDGVKKHADNSAFYDVRVFSNAKQKDVFVRELIAQGYQKQ